jgi:hypothetical protein
MPVSQATPPARTPEICNQSPSIPPRCLLLVRRRYAHPVNDVMNDIQFRMLLLAYAALIALNVVLKRLPLYGGAIRRDLVRDYLRSRPRVRSLPFIVVGAFIIAGGIIGYVGMLFFWSPAPIIFTIATVSKQIIFPVFIPVSNPKSEWERACGSIENMFDGFIAAITLLGPARSFFHQ